MSLPLDAREVLSELNQLGYRNISSGQLKKFMQDLKRLIKYEQTDSPIAASSNPVPFQSAPASVAACTRHPPVTAATSTTTTASTQRVRHQENQTSFSSSCQLPPASFQPPSTSHIRVGSISSASLHSDAHQRRRHHPSGSARIPLIPRCDALDNPPASGRRPASAPPPRAQQQLIRNTPTDLYQFYQRDWHRFQQHLPGEASRAGVRSAVRRMMAVQPPPKPRVFLAVHDDQTKSIRRK